MEGPQSLGQCRKEGRRGSPVKPGARRGDGFCAIAKVVNGKSVTLFCTVVPTLIFNNEPEVCFLCSSVLCVRL